MNGGVLHRAFSVIIFDEKGRMMLQKRSCTKYHSQSLWTNTCCSHPFPEEETTVAAHRRLMEEMGFDTPLKEIFSFKYSTTLDTGLTENEYDHVFVGTFDGLPKCNPEEVEDWQCIEPEALKKDICEHPEQYTAWFKIIIKEYFNFLEK